MKKKGLSWAEKMAAGLILSILAAVAFTQYQTSLQKARDVQRKAALGNISRALEAYRADYGHYPPGEKGMIVVEGESGKKNINWGDPFQADLNGDLLIYMKSLPGDPLSPAREFCYRSDGVNYSLAARLENKNDPQRQNIGYNCEGKKDYNYQVGNLK